MSERLTDEQLRAFVHARELKWDTCNQNDRDKRDLAAECLRLRKQVKGILDHNGHLEKSVYSRDKQLTAAKAVCDASKRCHNRDYHMWPKWADECDLCIAHKEFRAVMREGAE